jgi:small subunit ribosomal protein S8
MVNDPIADVLIRIKNGYLSGRTEVSVPYSKLVSNICDLLAKEGYIKAAKKGEKDIQMSLKYVDRKATLSDVKRISKPGLRVYSSSKDLPRVLNGLGIAIISTPKGLLTDKEARKVGLGGEVMAFVW